MVLICLKRIQCISLKDAQKLYKGYSLGLKVNGASICSGAEIVCRHRNAPPSLRSFSNQYEGLIQLCDEVQTLIEKRNSFIHGLIGFVIEEDHRQDAPSLISNGKILELKHQKLQELEESIMVIILRLSQLVPIPGLSIEITSAGELDYNIDQSAINPDDWIIVKSK